jgi:RNA polymerase sigma factor (sigma-70 family)
MHYDFHLLQNDALLVRHFRDDKAFERIERAIRGYCATSIRRSVGTFDEDIYQNTLHDIFRLIISPSWQPRRQPFRTMLVRVVSNAVRNGFVEGQRPSKRVNYEATVISALGGPEDSQIFEIEDVQASFEEAVLTRVAVDQALEKADSVTRQCAELLLQGLDYVEVGKRVQLSSSGVRHRLGALRKHIYVRDPLHANS